METVGLGRERKVFGDRGLGDDMIIAARRSEKYDAGLYSQFA